MKNKLEEIKAQYHLLKRNDYDLGAWDEPFSWLIEQAKRVQELEQKNDRLKQEADFWRVEDREMMRLSHENKRYREVINNINEKTSLFGVNEQVYEAIKEAIKALEDGNSD